MIYLAIDPGGTTGYALFDVEGKVLAFDSIKGHDNFLDWLDEQTPNIIILENYRIRPTVGHNFSDVPTLQLIGSIKRFAKTHNATLILQEPAALYMGLRYLGMYETYKSKNVHVPDRVSALAHGTYYMVKNKIAKHRLDKT